MSLIEVRDLRRAPLLLLTLSMCACPSTYKRTYPPPAPADLVSHVREFQGKVKTLRADTKADVWLGSDRANVTVNILAAWGGKLRFQAENPNNSMAADLGSDGQQYCYLDANHNCGDCGQATPEAVGRLLGVVLAPDDIVAILFGSTPVLDGDSKTSWDSSHGWEIVNIAGTGLSAGYHQRLALDGRNKTWDVRESEIFGPDGKRVFKIQHKDFHAVDTPAGQLRVPGASLLEQKGESAKITWRKQELDLELADTLFHVEVPAGLATCK